jgi:hypothetical protein
LTARTRSGAVAAGVCGKILNALTGAPLAQPRKKELRAAGADGRGESDTTERAAARCGVAETTSFRWRHRFPAAIKTGSITLKGLSKPTQPQPPAVSRVAPKVVENASASHANGMAPPSNCLGNHLPWFQRAILLKLPTFHSVLASVAGLNPCGRPLSMRNATCAQAYHEPGRGAMGDAGH